MLTTLPIELYEANAFIERLHRHHWAMQTHRFSLGAFLGARLRGVAICQRPTNQNVDYHRVLEVARLCTDGCYNACSILYAACARAAKELGYQKIQTFVLESEPAVTLRAAGWIYEGTVKASPWNQHRTTDDAVRLDLSSDEDKQRWARYLDQELERESRRIIKTYSEAEARTELNKLVRVAPSYVEAVELVEVPPGLEYAQAELEARHDEKRTTADEADASSAVG